MRASAMAAARATHQRRNGTGFVGGYAWRKTSGNQRNGFRSNVIERCNRSTRSEYPIPWAPAREERARYDRISATQNPTDSTREWDRRSRQILFPMESDDAISGPALLHDVRVLAALCTACSGTLGPNGTGLCGGRAPI